MSVLGSYEVHKSDHDFNPNIIRLIALARLTKGPREYIDCMYGGKGIEDIREDNAGKRNNNRRIDLESEREELER